MLTTGRLNNYAWDNSFADERERLEMILSAMEKDAEATEHWLDTDGSRAGLEAILATKRKVRSHNEGDE